MFRQLTIAIAAGLLLALVFTGDSGPRVQGTPKPAAETTTLHRYTVTLIADPDAGPEAENSSVGINSSSEIIDNVDAYPLTTTNLFAKDRWYHAYLYSQGKLRRLPTLGGQSNLATALNDKGEVIGYSDTGQMYADPHHSGAEYILHHGFLYSQGKMVDLGTFGGPDSWPTGINNKGEVVGGASLPDHIRHAFLYRHGKMLDLGTLGGNNSGAGGRRRPINNSGEIVGESDTANGESHAFLFSHGKMRDLGTLGGKESFAHDINEKGDVVGQSTTATGETHAFLYHQGKMMDLGSPTPGVRLWSSAIDINDRGDIIGDFDTSFGPENTPGGGSFLYSHGAIKDLRVFGRAYGLNNRGQVVGYYGVKHPLYRDGRISAYEGEDRPFLYEKGHLIDLIDCCPGYTAADFSRAAAINDRGQILVAGGKPTRCYLLTPR